jgi:tetratricopeptide (TPR) repeat protein
LETGLPVSKDFRTARYQGSTSQALVVYYPYPECLRVLDPRVEADLPRPVDMPKELKDAVPLSNLAQIIPDPAQPAQLPGDVFRYIPEENNWCYFYEKADLARQEGDWQAAADYADQALSQGRKLASTWELLPFIEGYARSGQLDKAHDLTLQAHQANPDGREVTGEILCTTWERMRQGSGNGEPGDLAAGAGEVLKELGCEK